MYNRSAYNPGSGEELSLVNMRKKIKNAGLYEEGMKPEEMKQLMKVLQASEASFNYDSQNSPLSDEENALEQTNSEDNSTQFNIEPFNLPAFKTSTSNDSSRNTHYLRNRHAASNFDLKNENHNNEDSCNSESNDANIQKQDENEQTPLEKQFEKFVNTINSCRHLYAVEIDENTLIGIDNIYPEENNPWPSYSGDVNKEVNPWLSCSSDLSKKEKDEFDKVVAEIEKRMDRLHEDFDLEHDEYGPPIEIGAKSNTLSSRKKPVGKQLPTGKSNAEVTLRSPSDRNAKRKALSIAGQDNFSFDNDSDDEFVPSNKKKKKNQQGKKVAEKAKINQENQKRNNSRFFDEPIDSESNKDVTIIDEEEFDNSNLHNLRKSNKIEKKNENPPQNSEETGSTLYPRRVLPPKKKFFKELRGQNKNKDSSFQSESSNYKKKSGLNEEEINETLDTIDEFCDGGTKPQVNLTLGTKNKISDRIGQAKSQLQNVHEEKEKNKKKYEEDKKKLEYEEAYKKDELISRRLQENEDENSRELAKDKYRKESAEFYHKFLGTKRMITRANFHKNNSTKSYTAVNEDDLGDENPISDEDTYVPKKYSQGKCPICQETYPNHQILNHAANCNQFSIDEFNSRQESNSQ